MAGLNLLGSLSRVMTPFVKVQIGKYVFGVYDKTTSSNYEANVDSAYAQHKIVYPNFIKRLQVKKINGQVNQYTLEIVYPVTAGSDPNFFEKVLGAVRNTRKIVFSYGDLSMPTFIYKEEEAIITSSKVNVTAASSSLSYVIQAVSSVKLTLASKKDFQAKLCKPSDRIKWLLKNNQEFGLQDVFYGMRDMGKVIRDGLIASDDAPVQLYYQPNMSPLDYLTYLVNSMVPINDAADTSKLSGFYSLVIVDDMTGQYDGPYFKVIKVDTKQEHPEAYEIDVGFPSQNIVTDISINTDEGYSLLYDYSQELNPEQYVRRVNAKGEMEEVYSPVVSSANGYFETRPVDKAWWSKITQFPINLTLTLRGLLRPAILMTYVRLNMYFFGQKYVASGLYVITQQQDTIDASGFKTTLTLLKISGDSDFAEFDKI